MAVAAELKSEAFHGLLLLRSVVFMGAMGKLTTARFGIAGALVLGGLALIAVGLLASHVQTIEKRVTTVERRIQTIRKVENVQLALTRAELRKLENQLRRIRLVLTPRSLKVLRGIVRRTERRSTGRRGGNHHGGPPPGHG